MTSDELHLYRAWSDERHKESMQRFDRIERLIERSDVRVSARMDRIEDRIHVVEQSTLDPDDVRKLRMVANAAAIARVVADKRLWPLLIVPVAGATFTFVAAAIRVVSAITG